MKKQKWWVCKECLAEIRAGKNEDKELFNHIQALHPEYLDVLLNTQKVSEVDYEEAIKNKFTTRYEKL